MNRRYLTFFSAILVGLMIIGCDNDPSAVNGQLVDACLIEPDSGPCDAAFLRYYYDPVEERCMEFTWGGCGGVVPFDTFEECVEACGGNYGGPFTDSSLLFNKWKVTSYGIVGEEKPPLEGTELTVHFRTDSSIGVFAGCNSCGGVYTAKDNGFISMTAQDCTEAMCGPIMEQEYRYLDALDNVSKFVIEPGHLHLYYDEGESVIHYIVDYPADNIK